jgi:hypothetical protein
LPLGLLAALFLHRGALPPAIICLTLLGPLSGPLLGVMALGVVGMAPPLSTGVGGLGVGPDDRAHKGGAERRQDAAPRLKSRVGQGLRQAVKAIQVHRCSSKCGLAAASLRIARRRGVPRLRYLSIDRR